jgi:excisionase family DNA binding protein
MSNDEQEQKSVSSISILSAQESEYHPMRKRKTTPATTPVDPSQVQLLDIPEVARRLSIGRTTVYSLINQGGLPTVKIGSATRIPLVSLRDWIEKNTTKAS